MPFPPANADLLLTDLADPHLSLHAVAAKHNTNLAALVLWMNAPEVAERLNQLRDACTARARLAAVMLLPTCAETLMAIADAQMADAEALRSEQTQSGPRVHSADADADPGAIAPSTPAEPPSLPTPREHALRIALLRTRAHESARRALSMVLRIARWHEPRPREHHQPHQASRSETTSQTHASAAAGFRSSSDLTHPSPFLDAPLSDSSLAQSISSQPADRARQTNADPPLPLHLEALLSALVAATDLSTTADQSNPPSPGAIEAEQRETSMRHAPAVPRPVGIAGVPTIHPATTQPDQPVVSNLDRAPTSRESRAPVAEPRPIDARAGPPPPIRRSA